MSFTIDSLLKHQDKYREFLTSRQGIYGIATAVALISAYSLSRLGGKDKTPVVPYRLPLKGSTSEYRQNPQAFVEKYAKLYGPVYRAYLFGEMMTVVTGSYVREVFLNEDFDFFEGIAKTFDTRLLCNVGNEEQLPTDEVATLIKRCLTPRLDLYTARVNKQLESAAEDVVGDLKDGGKDIMHLYTLVQHMVAKASATVFVGADLAENLSLLDTFKNMVIEVGSELKPKPWLEPFPRIARLRQWFIGKTSPVVRRHRQQLRDALGPTVQDRVARAKREGAEFKRPDDILQDIIELYFKRPNTLDLETYVVDTLTTLIFAALHTTSENSTVVLYRLLAQPEVMDDLVAEQETVLSQEGYPKDASAEVMTRQMIKKFEKLDSVCRESFRLRNDFLALPHFYRGKDDLTLTNGTVIKPGQRVMVNAWMNHHNESTPKSATVDNWGWDPYRFVGQDTQATKISENYIFFGLGKHACPGRFFAVQEAKVLISTLLRNYKLTPIDAPVFPTDDTMKLPMGRVHIERRI